MIAQNAEFCFDYADEFVRWLSSDCDTALVARIELRAQPLTQRDIDLLRTAFAAGLCIGAETVGKIVKANTIQPGNC